MLFDDEEAASTSILVRSGAMRQHIAMVGDNLCIALHRDTLRSTVLRGGAYHPKLREFEVGEYVYYDSPSSRTILDAQAQPMVLRVIEACTRGVLVLEG